RLIILMFHWLLFRLRFLSGLSKLLSDDPSWSGLTTLNYYFETQPLPHLGSWYAHQLPQWLLQAGTGMVLFSELIVPFFIFLPRPFRISAAVITLVIQLCIVATSNHNFVNLLTILLCLFLIDDRVIRRFFPQNFLQPIGIGRVMGSMKKTLLVTVVSAVFVISLLRMFTMVTGEQLPPALNRLERVGHSYGLGNVYHIFPTMQTERQELVIEGSHDGAVWNPYLFRYKPDLLDKTPAIIIPHQPRLDWMIWFVPPRNQEMKIWFDRFM
ncbi:MAG: lipase maturation factor family protein, partial [bacterium]|nr:lipase maturation factor family protein [bacterium]